MAAQRYEYFKGFDYDRMEEHGHGTYVLYTDYAATEAQRDNALDDLKAEIANHREDSETLERFWRALTVIAKGKHPDDADHRATAKRALGIDA